MPPGFLIDQTGDIPENGLVGVGAPSTRKKAWLLSNVQVLVLEERNCLCMLLVNILKSSAAFATVGDSSTNLWTCGIGVIHAPYT